MKWFEKAEQQTDESVTQPLEGELIDCNPIQPEETNSESGLSIASTESAVSILSSGGAALSVASTVEEVKDIRDKAEAMRKYVETSGLGLNAQNEVAELKLRAERMAGQMLAELSLHGGKRNARSKKLKLEELGISKDQSSRWQLLARVTDRKFDEFIESVCQNGQELTTALALRFARKLVGRRRVKTTTDEQKQVTGSLASLLELQLLNQRFGCLLVDPPWPNRHAVAMSIQQICDLPVAELALEQSHLHLWTPDENIFDAQLVLQAWGFELAGVFVWVRPTRGSGRFWRCSHELLLLGIKGDCEFRSKTAMSWVQANRRGKGKKPTKIRRIIESVSPGPYVELFSNLETKGWVSCQMQD